MPAAPGVLGQVGVVGADATDVKSKRDGSESNMVDERRKRASMACRILLRKKFAKKRTLNMGFSFMVRATMVNLISFIWAI